MSKEALIIRAKEVKNATQIGENTATRVGGLMEDIVKEIPDVDFEATERSTNAVRSDGVYSDFEAMGEDIYLLNSVDAGDPVASDNPVAPRDYAAGDIFCAYQGDTPINHSRFVNARLYYVALQDGNEGDDMSGNLFMRTLSALEAIQKSSLIKLEADAVSVNIEQTLAPTQVQLAQRNIELEKGVANGVASLDNHGIIPQEQVNSISLAPQTLNETQKVQAQNNMMAKSYIPAQFNGLGKKVLAKNIQQVGGVSKNLMSQAFFQDEQGNDLENTVFVIQYDYDLNNATIIIPAGCTLQFDGGSISEGTLTFNNTIISGNVNILSQISGTLANKDIYIDWFLADKSVLNYNRVNDVVSVANNANIHFNGVYNDSYDSEADSLLRGMTIKSGISYIGNNCTIYYQKTGTLRNFVFNDKHNYEGNDYVENVLITGFNFVCTRNSEGDTFIHHFATIALGRAKNCRIENCSFNNWLGDAIAVAYIFNQSRTAHVKGLSENIVIKNCIFNGPGIRDDYKERNAISVLDCDGFVIESCTFKNMGAASQPSCIDFEPEKIGSEAVMKVDNVEVKDCYFYNVYAGVACVSFYSFTTNATINANGTYHVKGNKFKNCANVMRIEMNDGQYVIQGNVFESIYGDNFRFETGTINFIENTINNSKCYVYLGYSKKTPVVNIKNNIFNKLLGYAAYNFFFIAVSGICNFTDNLIYDCGDYGASDYHEGILTLSFQVEGSVASFVRNTFFETRGYFCGVYKGAFTLKDVNTIVILNSGKTFNPYNSGIDTDQLTVK